MMAVKPVTTQGTNSSVTTSSSVIGGARCSSGLPREAHAGARTQFFRFIHIFPVRIFLRRRKWYVSVIPVTHSHTFPLNGIRDSAAGEGSCDEVFTGLLVTNGDDLRAFIAALTRDSSVRDDLYQETARALWTAFDHYDPSRPFGAWARGVARHVILQFRRRIFRESAIFSPTAMETIAAAWEQEAEQDDSPRMLRLAALQECLAAQPPASREAITAFYTGGHRVATIAATMGHTIDAVYQLLSRTRARLAACIRARMRDYDCADQS